MGSRDAETTGREARSRAAWPGTAYAEPCLPVDRLVSYGENPCDHSQGTAFSQAIQRICLPTPPPDLTKGASQCAATSGPKRQMR